MLKIATWGDVCQRIFSSKRMQSFYWRTGMMCLAIIIDQMILLINNVGLAPIVVVLLGLSLGELSKGIHNALSDK